jgi:sigma-B regulation protein RsbU (phosphoserine phosphatase)
VSELATGGTVVGPLPEARFRHGHARVDPGDVLVMCTDGILERRNPGGEFFGEQRLRATVQEAGAASAAEVLEQLFRAASDFSRRRTWEDDATLVVLRRTDQAAAARSGR